MRVAFGTVAGAKVAVVSSTLLLVLTPIHEPGLVSVTVANLASNGTDVAGEVATMTGAYTFKRPDLTAARDLPRLIAQLIIELRRQVLANTVQTTHTDFDGTTGDGLNITEIAELPALVLGGPGLPENRFYTENAVRSARAGGTWTARRPGRTVDLEFTLTGVSDHPVQLLNLLAEVEGFAKRNVYLSMDRDPADPSKGTVRWELDVPREGGGFKAAPGANASNLHTFDGKLVVRGFTIDDLDMVVAKGGTVEDIVVDGSVLDPPKVADVTVTQIGPSYPTGPSL